tara:strand:+ start:6538 stop:6672 length:135 start_codon:yes stop_codon:yes gene_type:complete
MTNLFDSLKTWFFELIEDALGEKTMKKYKEEITKKGESQKNDNL